MFAANAQNQPYLYEPSRGSQAQPSASSQIDPKGSSVYYRYTTCASSTSASPLLGSLVMAAVVSELPSDSSLSDTQVLPE